MNQHELLLLVTKYFSRFKEQVKILNANGEFSINIHSENILIKILNIVYSSEFENLNYEEGKNYDSIDLRDKNGKYAFQITATSNIKKIKETLEKYINNNHFQTYKELKILILTGRQEKYSQDAIDKVLKNKIEFDVNSNVIDFTNLYLELNKTNDLSKILIVKNLLEEQFSDISSNSEVVRNIKNFTELCHEIKPYLDENEKVFINFGPNSGAASKGPVRWDLTLWYKARREKLLPNNKVICNLIKTYTSLIPHENLNVFNLFENHVYAFEKHCDDPYFDYSQYLFPKEFSKIITDEICK